MTPEIGALALFSIIVYYHRMTTLRDIWMAKGMTSADVASKARCSVATIYKLNRREDKGIAFAIIKRVCAALDLSLNEYDRLEACPMSERYRKDVNP
jgi:DNA-binding Xre family transcriptional regulator